MKTKTLRIISWITLAFLPLSSVLAAPAGQITQSSGYVAVSSPTSVPKVVGSGEGVESGQTITLGDNAHAVVKFADGQIIALQSKSIFKINSYRYDQAAPEKGESFFSLLQGGLRAVTGLIGANNKAAFKLATPTATIGIRGTEFLFVVTPNGTYFQVISGSITITNSAGTVVINAGQTALVTSGSSAATVVNPATVPPGTFNGVTSINLSATGGSAAGAAGAGGTVLGVPTGIVVGVGIAAGAAAAASSGGSDTTTHH